MATYLDRILAVHRAAAAADARPLADLLDAARRCPPARGFRAALTGGDRAALTRGDRAALTGGDRAALTGGDRGRLAVIAEVKRRSPTKGDLAPDVVAEVLAKAYEDGGAACLSVLTDREFFGGSADDLAEARAATALPVLRKDFTVGEADVCDARLMGADAVLLIVAALSPPEVHRLLALAVDVGLDALVEVHDELELDVALSAGATMVGVNQRDLVTFEVDTGRAERVVSAIPGGVVKVAESGIRGGADARRLADAGFDAVLVGESLVSSPDPAAVIRGLRCS